MKYSIGEMSKLFGIPVTTLRHYHNKGIFKAFYIDEESGYRYYSSEQFELLNNILNLRYSKVPLERIKEYTEKGELTSLKKLFENQRDELRMKIEELERAERSVEERLRYIEEVEGIERFGRIIVEKKPVRRIFSVKNSFVTEEELELVVRELGRVSDFSASLVLGSVGLIMRREGEWEKYSGVYLVGEKFPEALQVEEQPEGEYIRVYFKGTRNDSPRYYKMMEEYIEEKGVEVEGPYYEMALVSNSMASKEREYIRVIEIKKKS
ncbi:GntR family transcriptional regulator [Propionigenium maris DSM 9537]|uniref:GntR family transcriptional regulator n=1 Tax=Propionigenium maris DSM 9537 TaxID=1123000 RepID=A0A9W6GP04_9FUSO|nr:helix-turn-helix domain-containing protein [Propionigenium maris]GLI57480.1 GntR family transcriptional regulator [Propionigenium maris DSM 9537]